MKKWDKIRDYILTASDSSKKIYIYSETKFWAFLSFLMYFIHVKWDLVENVEKELSLFWV